MPDGKHRAPSGGTNTSEANNAGGVITAGKHAK